MLIQLFSEKCWLKNVGTTFSKNVKTFSIAQAGGKIKRRQFRVGWKFASLSTFR
jgi:hypothetical protein